MKKSINPLDLVGADICPVCEKSDMVDELVRPGAPSQGDYYCLRCKKQWNKLDLLI